MSRSAPTLAFRDGVLASLPVMIGLIPFALVFGVAAAESGLGDVEAMAMSAIVVAGAAQFTALQMMSENAPVWLVLLTGSVINLRMAMYSAAISAKWRGAPFWTRAVAAYFLHDQAFALSMQRYADHPQEPTPARMGFYFGVGVTTVSAWFLASYIGLQVGAGAPPEWALDFAVPATFIGAVAPLLRTAPHCLAAMVGAAASLGLIWLPFGLGVLIGALCGVAAGAAADLWIKGGGRPAPKQEAA